MVQITTDDSGPVRERKQSKDKGILSEEVLAHLKALEAEWNRREAAGEPRLTPEEAVEFVGALRKQSSVC